MPTRKEPAAAAGVADLLEFMPLQDAAGLVAKHCDTPWLDRCVGAMVEPSDEGLFWLALPGDVEIWPARVLVYSWEGERHAVWLTYQWPLGSDVVVSTQPGPPVLVPFQAGEPGRQYMLAGADQVAGEAGAAAGAGSVTP